MSKDNRRNNSKYPALEPKLNLKYRNFYLECDYAHKLNKEELEFLNKFLEEEINADFRHEKPLITDPDDRKRIYRDNNRRIRDTMNYTGKQKNLEYMDSWKPNDGRALDYSSVEKIEMKMEIELYKKNNPRRKRRSKTVKPQS